jgi:exodeoxyribonuclease VII small subunit
VALFFIRTEALFATTVAKSTTGSGVDVHEIRKKEREANRTGTFIVNFIDQASIICLRQATISCMSDVPDFETSLKRLEEIVKKLESGDLSLDSALELFEEGIKLSRFCHSRLEQAERRVEILLKNSSGQPAAVPFESENEH